jgi:uncharacterized membrane protein (DUF106 family)
LKKARQKQKKEKPKSKSAKSKNHKSKIKGTKKEKKEIQKGKTMVKNGCVHLHFFLHIICFFDLLVFFSFFLGLQMDKSIFFPFFFPF